MEKRVLVVEPSRDLRELICAILRRLHFDVDGVSDTSKVVSAKNYVLAIADLPFGEQPDAFADRITRSMPSLGKHLLLMSAAPEECEDCQAEMLVKPFDRQSLIDNVVRISAR